MSEREVAPGKIREVFPDTFVIHLPLPMRPTIVNVYLLRSGDEWALIDTGVNGHDSLAAFTGALAQVGCRPERIRTIICTHHHPDHFGSSKAYKELTGARLLIHAAEYDSSHFLAPGGGTPSATDFFRANGLPIDRFAHIPHPREFWSGLYVPTQPDGFIADGDVVRAGDREIRVVWTPGHTRGHCVMHLFREGLMIAGDHLLPKITPHVGYYPGGPPNPLGDFLDSQRKIQALDVRLVLPAHGGPFPDHHHRANQIIHHHHTRLQEIFDLVRRTPRDGYDVARHAFGFTSESSIAIQFPATFETLAHLEYLRQAGTVTRSERDGRIFYAAA
jgi:glyoxylase-like metal-dependent hydrolase (beta-lactamase superfamily II)